MKNLKLLYIAAFLCSYSALQCQTYTFEKFDSEQSVNPFVYNLTQDKNGFLLVGTGDGLLRYDGFEFRLFDESNGLGGSIVSCTFIDSHSNTWIGHSKSGKLSVLSDNKIKTIDISAYAKNKVVGISEDDSGNMWIATQNEGLLRYDVNGEFKMFKDDLDGYLIISIQDLGGNNLALGTNEGVFIVENLNVDPKFVFLDEGPYTKVFDFEKSGSAHVLCTEDDGLYKIFFNNGTFQIEQIFDDFNLASYKMTDIQFAKDGLMYITAGEELLELKTSEGAAFQILSLKNLNLGNPMKSSNLKSSFVDSEKNLWIASFGDGLFKMNNSYFTFYDLPNDPEILGLSQYKEELIASTKGNVYSFTNENGTDDVAVLTLSLIHI